MHAAPGLGTAALLELLLEVKGRLGDAFFFSSLPLVLAMHAGALGSKGALLRRHSALCSLFTGLCQKHSP